MVCKNCNQEFDDNLKTCPHCGGNQKIDVEEPKCDSSSKLLFWFLLIYVITGFILAPLANLLSFNFYDIKTESYSFGFRIIVGIIWIVNGLSFLLLPPAIKNKKLKVIAYILVGIVVAFCLIRNIIDIIGLGNLFAA